MMWHEWLAKASTPDAVLARHRILSQLAPLLRHPRLWALHRPAIARGVAVGVFFGFLIPVAQIPAAALVSFALRANVGAAVVSTFVTNPLTFPPVYLAAYRLGSFILDEPMERSHERALKRAGMTSTAGASPGLLTSVGKPLAVGLASLACVGALASYVLVTIAWEIAERLRRSHPGS
jgi:uncharacterized protein